MRRHCAPWAIWLDWLAMSNARTSWPLQDAKNRFSEVVEEALRNGPQVITRRGAKTVVVVSVEEWERLARPRCALIDLLQRAPRTPGGLETTRSRDTGRRVDI